MGDGLKSGVFGFYFPSNGRNKLCTPVTVGDLVPLLEVWVWIHHPVSLCLSLNIVCLIWITFPFFTHCIFWFYGAWLCSNDHFWCSYKVLLVVGAPGFEDERKAGGVCQCRAALWGSYLNLCFGASWVCSCLRSDGGLTEWILFLPLGFIGLCLLQSGPIRTFLWPNDPCTAILLVQWCALLWVSVLKCPISV